MKEQPLHPIFSEKFHAYDYKKNGKRFDEHGFFDYCKIYSCKTIDRQNFEKYNGSKEIWCSTEIGQPFLYWNNNDEIDVGGVLDYDSVLQTGTFAQNTKEGRLEISNVHSYLCFFNINGKYLPANSRYLPETSEIEDLYVAAIVAQDKTFDLLIYHNINKIYVKQNVFPELYIFYGENTAYKNRFSYIRFAKKMNDTDNFENFIYNIAKEEVYKLDASAKYPSWFIDYSKYTVPTFSNHLGELIDGKNISIVCHLDNSKTSAVMFNYIKNMSDSSTQIKNIFEDDDTINIVATFNNKPQCVLFIYYCAKVYPKIFGHSIYGVSMDDLEKGSLNHYLEYKSALKIPQNELSFYKRLNKALFEKCKEQRKINQLPKFIYTNYISSHDMISILYRYLTDIVSFSVPWILSYMGKDDYQQYDFKKEKEIYENIYQKLIQWGKIGSRWKNENNLFKVVKKEYPDALYQYHSEWLGRQSLDIYIPSLRIGIEYQGIQHYEAVDYFGGDKSLEEQKQRDNLKRTKCDQQGVRLIEWRYDEPISKVKLKEKINSF